MGAFSVGAFLLGAFQYYDRLHSLNTNYRQPLKVKLIKAEKSKFQIQEWRR